MILDFYHNKIVSDTVSEGFIDSFTKNLVPKLTEKYGTGLFGVQMYEDFISDNLIQNGYAYYPLTVIIGGGFEILWIKWSVECAADFSGGVPYAYIGKEPLCFELCQSAPAAFSHVTDNRRMYFDGEILPIHINTVIDSVKLSGKYSQTFLDELAYAVNREIERAMAVSGLSSTGIRLEIPFAPETYMEHTSENLTYRRILISDKTSAPKDLWIKWTRLNSAVGYSVCDNVASENITFELGEDVPQKIREKEYRYLTRISPTKYQAAMGRKNVTEWRELIKRAIKRGELVRAQIPEANDAAGAMMDEVDRILEKIGYTAPDVPKSEPIVNSSYDDELMRAIQLAEKTVMGSADESDEEISFMPEGLTLEIEKTEPAPQTEDELELEKIEEIEETEETEEIEEPEAVEETEAAEEIEESEKIEEIEEAESEKTQDSEDDDTLPWEEKPSAASYANEESDELNAGEESDGEIVDDENSDDELSAEEEKRVLDELMKLDADIFDLVDDEIDDEEALAADFEAEAEDSDEADDAVDESERNAEAVAEVERLKAEKTALESTLRLKIEEEIERRREVESELAKALAECRRLSAERDNMSAKLERAIAEKETQAEAHRGERAELVGQIEARIRAEEREKSRLAEAALAEMEERRRAEEEAIRAEQQRRAAAEERQKQLEAERAEAQREAERARILTETMLQRNTAPAEPVAYTSYVVRLVFRHSVDPNSINQIGELIKTTVAYYKKDDLKIRVKASLPEPLTVRLDFTNIPEDEHELIVNIIKVLGNSHLGIAKAILD